MYKLKKSLINNFKTNIIKLILNYIILKQNMLNLNKKVDSLRFKLLDQQNLIMLGKQKTKIFKLLQIN